MELFEDTIVNFRPIDLVFPTLKRVQRDFMRADHLHKGQKTLRLNVVGAHIQVFDTFGLCKGLSKFFQAVRPKLIVLDEQLFKIRVGRHKIGKALHRDWGEIVPRNVQIAYISVLEAVIDNRHAFVGDLAVG